MSGLWILLLLIGVSALPVFAVLIWFKTSAFPMSPRRFVCFLLGGTVALLLAALAQNVLFSQAAAPGLRNLLFKTFIQIALTEEGGRLLVLFIIFKAIRPDSRSFASAAGLLTGLGFAVVETAFYGAVDLRLALLRAFTSAPLHGACGARVGFAAYSLGREPVPGALRFCTAAAIHGMYNLMIISPGPPAVLSFFIAYSALASAIAVIRSKPKE